MLSPLERAEAVKKTVLRVKRTNPDFSMTAIAKRAGISTHLCKQLLKDGPVYPKEYKQAAGHITRTLEKKAKKEGREARVMAVAEFTEQSEKGNAFCTACEVWESRELRFYKSQGGSSRHQVVYCKSLQAKRRKEKERKKECAKQN